MPARFLEYHLSSLTRSSVCRKRTRPLPACNAEAGVLGTIICLLTLAFPSFLVLVDKCKVQTMRPSFGSDQRWAPDVQAGFATGIVYLRGRAIQSSGVPAGPNAPVFLLLPLRSGKRRCIQHAYSNRGVNISVPLYYTIPLEQNFRLRFMLTLECVMR